MRCTLTFMTYLFVGVSQDLRSDALTLPESSITAGWFDSAKLRTVVYQEVQIVYFDQV